MSAAVNSLLQFELKKIESCSASTSIEQASAQRAVYGRTKFPELIRRIDVNISIILTDKVLACMCHAMAGSTRSKHTVKSKQSKDIVSGYLTLL